MIKRLAVALILAASAAISFAQHTGGGGGGVPGGPGVTPEGAAGGALSGNYPNPGGVVGTFNVLNYGAKCDGVTNDTSAFQATVTAAAAFVQAGSGFILPGSGATVVLPAGTCLTGPLTGATGVLFSGQGEFATTLKLVSGSNASLFTFANEGNFGVVNMTINGNAANQTGTSNAITITQSGSYVDQLGLFANLYIFQPLNNGFYLGANTGSNTFYNLTIYQPYADCLYVAGYDNKFDTIDCGFAGLTGVDFEAANNQITNSKVWGTGFTTQAGAYAVIFNRSGEQASNLLIQDNGVAGLEVSYPFAQCENCFFQNNGLSLTGTAACGVVLNGTTSGSVITGVSTATSDQTAKQQYGACFMDADATSNTVRLTTSANLTAPVYFNNGCNNNEVHITDSTSAPSVSATTDCFVDESGAVFGNATGGAEGAGTANFSGGVYVNGVNISGGSSNWSAVLGGANTSPTAFSTLAPWSFSASATTSSPGILLSGSPDAATGGYPVQYISPSGTTNPTFNSSGEMIDVNAAAGFAGYLQVWNLAGAFKASVNYAGQMQAQTFYSSSNEFIFNTRANLFASTTGLIEVGTGGTEGVGGSLSATNYTAALGGLFETTHGSNATAGVVTLASGTATVSTTAVAALASAGGAGDVIQLTLENCSSCGSLSVGTVTAATSFVINSTSGTDASNVYWEIKKLN